MTSIPLDKYEADVYELAEHLAKETGMEYSKKKNRVRFLKEEKLLKALGIQGEIKMAQVVRPCANKEIKTICKAILLWSAHLI